MHHQIHPGHPQPNEYGPFFAAYIGKGQSIEEPIAALELQLDDVLESLRPLHEAQQKHRYAEGKWSIKELVNHMSDAERIFAYRALRVARNDKTPMAPFDENPYVAAAEAERVEWKDLLDEFESVRNSSILLLRNMPEAAWTRIGIASGHPISVRAMVWVMYGHVAHHMGIVRERYL